MFRQGTAEGKDLKTAISGRMDMTHANLIAPHYPGILASLQSHLAVAEKAVFNNVCRVIATENLTFDGSELVQERSTGAPPFWTRSLGSPLWASGQSTQ